MKYYYGETYAYIESKKKSVPVGSQVIYAKNACEAFEKMIENIPEKQSHFIKNFKRIE